MKKIKFLKVKFDVMDQFGHEKKKNNNKKSEIFMQQLVHEEIKKRKVKVRPIFFSKSLDCDNARSLLKVF